MGWDQDGIRRSGSNLAGQPKLVSPCPCPFLLACVIRGEKRSDSTGPCSTIRCDGVYACFWNDRVLRIRNYTSISNPSTSAPLSPHGFRHGGVKRTYTESHEEYPVVPIVQRDSHGPPCCESRHVSPLDCSIHHIDLSPYTLADHESRLSKPVLRQ